MIPVDNEQISIKDTIESISHHIELNKNKNLNVNILVVNDGSTDNTSKILDNLNCRYLIVINRSTNFGYGYSIKQGVEGSQSDYVAIIDADGSYTINKVIELYDDCISGENVELHVANAKEELPIEHKSVDVIFMDGALHHMTDIDLIRKSLGGYAKKGAYLVARESQSGNFIIQIMRKLRMVFDKSYSSEQVFLRKKELASLMVNSGIANVKN